MRIRSELKLEKYSPKTILQRRVVVEVMAVSLNSILPADGEWVHLQVKSIWMRYQEHPLQLTIKELSNSQQRRYAHKSFRSQSWSFPMDENEIGVLRNRIIWYLFGWTDSMWAVVRLEIMNSLRFCKWTEGKERIKVQL